MTTLGTKLGGLSVPLEPPARGAAAGDPALTVFAPYLKAFLTTYAGAAWQGIVKGEPIVRNVFTHDPEDYDFVENDLPALYLFRVGSGRQIEQLAEDWRVHHDTVRIFWVLPNLGQGKQHKLTPFFPAVGKLIDAAFDRNRDPCFVLSSDPDATKTRQGTVVTRAAGVEYAKGNEWKKIRLGIAMRAGEGQRLLYDAVDFKLDIGERVIQGFEDLSSPAALDVKVAVDGTTVPPDFVDVSEFRSS